MDLLGADASVRRLCALAHARRVVANGVREVLGAWEYSLDDRAADAAEPDVGERLVLGSAASERGVLRLLFGEARERCVCASARGCRAVERACLGGQFADDVRYARADILVVDRRPLARGTGGGDVLLPRELQVVSE